MSTWIAPLEPKVTPCARDDRGDFVARPHEFVECATSLVDAYRKADSKTRSLVRHLSVAVNPHSKSRAADRFLFMYSALERAVEVAWKQNQTPQNPHFTTKALTGHLEQLRKAVADQGGENALEISARLKGLIDVANRPGIRDKLQAFVRAYPMMASYCRDLWPILGSDRRRGLREIRNALAHGSRTSVSSDVLAVAEWHLAILLERVIFMLLGLTLPDGISPGSILLRTAAMGWYEPDQWGPLQSKLGPSI
ncbi:hypothetical protein [Panacagrimonas sp.]|uniref:hypothetical protein n=1 Tax=Panacagrimonas sp. TaxID=2480088 RepID=UPI003B528575